MNQTYRALARQSTEGDAPRSFPALLEKYKAEVARALPRHLNADRMARIALSAYRQTPKLAECDPRSIFAAVVQAAQLGLEVGVLGEAHLIPYDGECQLVPGYAGLMKLARQSGLVRDIYAHEVRERDEFSLTFGLRRELVHRPLTRGNGFPAPDDQRGAITGAYAVAVLSDESRTFTAMGIEEILAIRDASRGYQAAKRAKRQTPWETHPTAMVLKTVVRRLCKFLPKSAELATALSLSDINESGRKQELVLEEVAAGSYTPAAQSLDEPPTTPADAEAGQPLPATPAEALARIEACETAERLEQVYAELEPQLSGGVLEALQRGYTAARQRVMKK